MPRHAETGRHTGMTVEEHTPVRDTQTGRLQKDSRGALNIPWTVPEAEAWQGQW